MLSRRPEAMAHAVDAAADLDGLVDVADVVAIGPGLGQDAWGDAPFSALIDKAKPMVGGADARNSLATRPRRLQAESVITPQPGDGARLWPCETHALPAASRPGAPERRGGL